MQTNSFTILRTSIVKRRMNSVAIIEDAALAGQRELALVGAVTGENGRASASGDRRGRDRWLESPGPSATTATPSEVRGRHARCAVHTSFIALILLSNGDGELQRAFKPYALAGVSERCVRTLDI